MSRQKNKNMKVTVYDVARVFGIHAQRVFSLNALVQECGYKKRASYYIEELVGILEHHNVVEYNKGYILSKKALRYTGVLTFTRGGGSFCSVEGSEDIFIPLEGRYGARSNDIVDVLVIIPKTKDHKAEGCVIHIHGNKYQYIPARVIQKVSLTTFLFESVLVSLPMHFLVTFEHERDIPYNIFSLIYTVAKGKLYNEHVWMGELVECLGIEESVSTQEKIVQIEHSLRRTFPESIDISIVDIPRTVDRKRYSKRNDLGDLTFVTIDGDDSRDFDDAICVKVTEEGYILYVAIADVTEYVKINTPLDTEAYLRSNSYYFPTMVLPMLPQELSNGICSLHPYVDRLAMIVEVKISKSGRILNKEVYEGIIRSHGRLTYAQVQAYFDAKDRNKESSTQGNSSISVKDGEGYVNIAEQKKTTLQNGDEYNNTQEVVSPLTDSIQQMLCNARELARILCRIRYERGALFFTSMTPSYIIENDRVSRISAYPRYCSHMLIEECMLVANESVAEILTEHGYPVVYRTHSPPAQEKLEALRIYAVSCFPHQRIPKTDEPQFLSTLLKIIKGKPQESIFHTVAIRSMMQARYSLVHEGHYGLQSQAYCHFTSPIRRYADCFMHRIVKAYLYKRKISHDEEEAINSALALINKNERLAMSTEREIHKRLGILYMKQYIGTQQKAIISNISRHALYVDFPSYALSGIILLSSLSDDYYEVIEEQQRIEGRRTGKIYTLGDSVTVIIVSASLSSLEVQCHIKSSRGRVCFQYRRRVSNINHKKSKKKNNRRRRQ